MAAVEELKKELEAEVDIDRVVKDITARLDLDMRTIHRRQGGFSEDVYFEVDFDLAGQSMAELGLIRTHYSSFKLISYSYTPKARDLYTRLQEEKYYEPKTE